MSASLDHPLRLAAGTYRAGSGKGCAMNLISWENGDAEITDFPACTARPLARLVQIVNDSICAHGDGDLLCPACSAVVLDLAHMTVGTAGATQQQEAAWIAELLDSPSWGIIRCASEQGEAAIRRVAYLFRRRAAGDEPSPGQWEAARAAASEAAGTRTRVAAAGAAGSVFASSAAAAGAAGAASDVAAAGVIAADAARCPASDVAAAGVIVADAARCAAICTPPSAQALAAIRAWHRICGTVPARPSQGAPEQAIARMLTVL